MMFAGAAVLLLLCTCGEAAWPTPKNGAKYDQKVELLADKYYLFWKKTGMDKVTFEMHVKTAGWVGLGISREGGMNGADIGVGWVTGGQGQFSDRWSDSRRAPKVDASQDWTLDGSWEEGGFTVLKVTRPLVTCDKEDIDIVGQNTVRLIWAIGRQDPPGNAEIAYHGNQASSRGTKSIQLFGSSAARYADKAPALPSDAFAFDITVKNVRIPSNKETTYWCQGMKIPTNVKGKEHHVVMVEPVITKGNEAAVHHIIAYTCFGPLDENTHAITFDCGSANMPNAPKERQNLQTQCTLGSFSWAIGGGKMYYPEDTGHNIGGPTDKVTFIRLEIHYDNPLRRTDYVDSSGLRLWMTPTLRPKSAGTMWAGVIVQPMQAVPPGLTTFTSYGWCHRDCLAEALPKDGVKVLFYGLHTHIYGIAARLRHYRNGREIQMFANDDYYDNNYQEFRPPVYSAMIKPGDELVQECVYDTSKRQTPVFGGQATKEEMCLTILIVSPKVNLGSCMSSIVMNDVIKKTLEDEPTVQYTTSPQGALQVSGSSGVDGTYQNVGMWMQFMSKLQWTSTKVRNYQNAINGGNHYMYCAIGQEAAWKSKASTIQLKKVTPVTQYVRDTPPKCGAPAFPSSVPLLVTMATALLSASLTI